MTTFLYTTVSEGGDISSADRVENIVGKYFFTVEPTISEHHISFNSVESPNGGFGIYLDANQTLEAEEEFFEELAPYLESDLRVKSVEVQGVGMPSCWSWEVFPDGNVEFNQL